MRINYNMNSEGETSHYSLFIGSPAYSGTLDCHYTVSLIQTCEMLKEKGIGHTVYFSVYDSLVARTRNDLADKFLKSDCTHILMIDSDQGWNPFVIPKMLDMNQPFITGAVPGRKVEETYALEICLNQDKSPVQNEQNLIKAAHNGVAFALVKREVFERIKDETLYRQDVYPYFQHVYTKEGDHYGEDTYFVKTWQDIGGDVWIYPDITFTHGPITANYQEYLLRTSKKTGDIFSQLDQALLNVKSD